MADEKNEPSEQTKQLLERTRAAKAKQGQDAKTVTVIEDAKPVNTPATPQPPADNAHVATGAELFTQPQPTQPEPARIQNNETDNEPAASNDEFKRQTRTMSRTEAERERGRQVIAKNEAARARAQAAQREADED